MSTLLLPTPRHLIDRPGMLVLPSSTLIVIPNASLWFEAQTAQQALSQESARRWEIVAGTHVPETGLRLACDAQLPPQGYRLEIGENGIEIAGGDAAGVFYGVCTLRQLLRAHGAALPQVTITDWPDFPARGVMLDISRDRVPTLAAVLELVDLLASWKINQFQLYMEHTFAYPRHRGVWAAASPFTGEEILQLDAYCRQRHVDLVPNQNSLGHMERWLKVEPYGALAECPEGFEDEQGQHHRPTTLNPIDPASLELVGGLYGDLLPHFTSRLFNVGGDEPWELGQGRSRSYAERVGGGRLYLEYLLRLRDLVTAQGRQMLFWGDIIIKYPDLVPQLPRDIVALEWGYEADHPFDEHAALFAGSGVPFYVCPGTSSWNSLSGRTANALGNLRSAAHNGLKHGAIGVLTTDWGDNGHWQPLPVSYLGFAYGAAVSWGVEANQNIDLPRALDCYAFRDRAGVMGRLAYDLGNLYQLPGLAHHNGQALFGILQKPLSAEPRVRDPEVFRRALTCIDAIMAPLDGADVQRPDAAIIRQEYRLVADLLRHACYRGLLQLEQPERSRVALLHDLQELILRYRALWLARCRQGGLEDSVQRFVPALKELAEA